MIPAALFPDLLDAADEVTDLARSRRWPQVRIVGKQFPPWTAGDDVWGVQNLLHPALDALSDGQGGVGQVFREWYGSEGILGVSAALMGCAISEMQFGMSPSSRPPPPPPSPWSCRGGLC